VPRASPVSTSSFTPCHRCYPAGESCRIGLVSDNSCCFRALSTVSATGFPRDEATSAFTARCNLVRCIYSFLSILSEGSVIMPSASTCVLSKKQVPGSHDLRKARVSGAFDGGLCESSRSQRAAQLDAVHACRCPNSAPWSILKKRPLPTGFRRRCCLDFSPSRTAVTYIVCMSQN
jgi:hypothetical protein